MKIQLEQEKSHLIETFDLEREKIKADFRLEIKVKDALILQLNQKVDQTKQLMRKLLKMMEHPRLLEMSNKLLKAEAERFKEEENQLK